MSPNEVSIRTDIEGNQYFYGYIKENALINLDYKIEIII